VTRHCMSASKLNMMYLADRMAVHLSRSPHPRRRDV
jgi:hypothetical protein